jgi:uncharacterized membrane protein YqhA
MSLDGGHKDDGARLDGDLPPRGGGGGLLAQLIKIRYIAIVVVILAILHALAFLFLGGRIAFHAYRLIIRGSHAGENMRPGLELLHSLDFLLISLVLLILGLGVAKLFLLPPETGRSRYTLPTWLRMETFSDLKVLLWETILTALVVFGLPTLSAELVGKLQWTSLVLPAAIMLLALGLYFMKKA